MALPSFFISHGAPDIVLQHSEARDYLAGFSNLVDKPDAIVIASAHFETAGAAVVSDPSPATIHDFGGFAPELYEMAYPAKGSPELAQRVADMLKTAGLDVELLSERGFDHGTWTPMMLAWPLGEIPIVQVSIDPGRDAAYHYALGKALAPLRDENILLVGSGHITHNLRAVFAALRPGTESGGSANQPLNQTMIEKVDKFTQWFSDNLAANNTEAILNWKEKAPFASDNHPTDEHLMPLFFAYGAGGDSPSVTLQHDSRQFGFFAFNSYSFA